MAVDFDPLPVPRFDKSLLSYLDRSFQNVRKAISDLNRRATISPQFFSWSLTNGPSWPMVDVVANNNLLTAQYPLRMIVQVSGSTGFSGGPVPYGVNYQIRDEAGTPISPNSQFFANGIRITTNGEIRPMAMQAYKDYNVNQVCGFRFAYQVDALGGANVYHDLSAVVSFWPRG